LFSFLALACSLLLLVAGLFVSLYARATSDLPLVSRSLVAVSLVFLLPTLLPLSWITEPLQDATGLCVAPLLDGSMSAVGLVWRWCLAPLQHSELAAGMLSTFAMGVLGSRIEQQRGSAAMAQLFITLLAVTQAAHILLMALLLSQSWMVAIARAAFINLTAESPSDHLNITLLGSSSPDLHEYSWAKILSLALLTQACYTNSYAIIFALMQVECRLLTKDDRRRSVAEWL
jgi:hypothetical protein